MTIYQTYTLEMTILQMTFCQTTILQKDSFKKRHGKWTVKQVIELWNCQNTIVCSQRSSSCKEIYVSECDVQHRYSTFT